MLKRKNKELMLNLLSRINKDHLKKLNKRNVWDVALTV